MNLVTGASGFIGGRIVHALAKRGEPVRILVRPGANLRGIAGLTYEHHEGDLLDRDSLARAVKGCSKVYHAAASYKLWARDPQLVYQTNVEGTRNLIEMASENKVERIVYTSSVATIGVPEQGLGTEDTPVQLDDMVGDYKRSKFMAEEAAIQLIHQGAPVVVVNPTFPVGEGDVKPTPTGKVIIDFLQKKMPSYLDTAMNVVDVDDVAAAHLLAAEKGKVGDRYILGNHNMSLKDLLVLLAEITGLPAPRVKLPYYPVLGLAYLDAALARVIPSREPRIPPAGVMMSRKKMIVDSSKAIKELNLPQTPVKVTLEKAVAWFRSHGYV